MTNSNHDDYLEVIARENLNPNELQRLDRIVEEFGKKTNKKPQFVACSAGRVNLIGDHIDYHGFSVLPMAIENSIWIACSAESKSESGGDRSSSLAIHNSDEQTYPSWRGEHSFSHGHALDQAHKWHNYVLCAYHGTLASEKLKTKPGDVYSEAKRLARDKKLLQQSDASLKSLANFNLLVDSDLPPASGLSSSSALVCASSIATKLLLIHSMGDEEDSIKIAGHVLADKCSKYEHLIGTHGGGMDQAVILTAQKDYAKYVEFRPELRCENVRLPDDTVWLVSHSGVSYPKAATSGYNARVLETKLGASMIAKILGPECNGLKLDKSITLAEVKGKLFASKTVSEMIEIIQNNVFENKDDFTADEVCKKLEISRSQLVDRFNTSEDFLDKEMKNKFKLLSRCQHVFEEAERVERFKSICDTTVDVALLGQLMTQSHYSLRDKYDCSHPALDRLVGVALEAGALGARLTGAGWGGCIVTLVEASKCETVYERLQEVSRFTFRTEPRTGSHIINLTSRSS